MNNDMVGGLVRALVPPVLAYLVGRGILPASDYGAVVTALVALLTAVWSVHSNKTGKIIK